MRSSQEARSSMNSLSIWELRRLRKTNKPLTNTSTLGHTALFTEGQTICKTSPAEVGMKN